jgi:hypothetical protein
MKWNNIYRAGILAVAVALMAACAPDSDMPGGRIGTGDRSGDTADGRTLVKFKIKTPEMQEVSTRAVGYTAANFENDIYNLLVIVMEQNDSDEWVYAYSAEAVNNYLTTPAESTATFDVGLKASNDPIKLFAIVNYQKFGGSYDHFMVNSLLQPGDSESTVRSHYVKQYNTYTNLNIGGDATQAITMTGEKILDSFSPVSSGVIEIPVIRSVAMIEINKNLLSGSKQFELTTVYIATPGASNHVQVIPNSTALDTQNSNIVIAPSIPNYSNGGKVFIRPTVTDDGSGNLTFSAPMFLPEYSGTTVAAEMTNACHIVIGGWLQDYPSYAGAPAPAPVETFYRIDLHSENGMVGQMLRNHKYIFNIRAVMDKGVSNPFGGGTDYTPIPYSSSARESATVSTRQSETITTVSL